MARRSVTLLTLILTLAACSAAKGSDIPEPVVEAPSEAATEPAPRAAPVPKPSEAPIPGQTTTTISGCLTQADGKPVASNTRGGSAVTPEAGLEVKGHSWGLLVSHSIHHACCLKGDVETSVEGNRVTVRELLSGKPCRCICSSTLTTRIPLLPGEYSVDVVVETNGTAAEALTTPATVRKVGLKPTPKP